MGRLSTTPRCGEGLGWEQFRVGLTYDLRAEYLERGYSTEAVAEFDSEETVAVLAATLGGFGCDVDRIGSLRALVQRLAGGARWDLVFNIAEGLGGRNRESQVPALLEAYDIPYTFSDPLVCGLTLDKALAKRLVAAAGIRTAAFAVVHERPDTAAIDLPFPLFVKPNAEGTGRGIDEHSVVTSRSGLARVCADLLERCGPPLLVEEFLPGREFTVAVLGTAAAATVLGTLEIQIPGDPRAIYSYTAKEECEALVRYSRLQPGPLRERVEQVALAAYLVLECRDAGRVDIRLNSSDEPCFLELNPLPGLHPTHSDLPMIATAEGMTYGELIAAIVRSAAVRAGPGRAESGASAGAAGGVSGECNT